MPKVGQYVRLIFANNVTRDGKVTKVTEDYYQLNGVNYQRSRVRAWMQIERNR